MRGFGFALDLLDTEAALLQGTAQSTRRRLVPDLRILACQVSLRIKVAAARELLASNRRQFGVEGRTGLLQPELDVPPDGGDEGHASLFALDQQLGRHALHSTCRCALSNLAPQERRHLVPVQTVEHAARFLRLDQVVIQLARGVDGLLDGRLGDLMEHHALHRHCRLQHF